MRHSTAPAGAGWGEPHRIESALKQDICSLASTPSCPGPVLLACVSKAWGAAAAQKLDQHGASITLALRCNDDSPQEQREREMERMLSFGSWLWQKGHLLTGLVIQVPHMDTDHYSSPVALSSHMVAVMEALAAASRRPGGLRLQRLSLPALGNTPLSSISRALSGCAQLRQLDLGYADGGAKTYLTHPTTKQQLPAALAQLTQVTSLTLNACLFQYNNTQYSSEDFEQEIHVDQLIQALPSSLVMLDVREGSSWGWTCHLHVTTLQHLVNLQQLTLPPQAYIRPHRSSSSSSSRNSSSSSSSSSSSLTALTSLVYPNALSYYKHVAFPPLDLPNLAALTTEASVEYPSTEGWEVLATNAAHTLRALTTEIRSDEGLSDGPYLAQLTALTSLVLHRDHDCLEPAPPVEAQGWCDAVSSLTRLRRLGVHAELLSLLDVAPLAALTHLQLDTSSSTPSQLTIVTCSSLVLLLQRLAPLGGGALREVEVVGVKEVALGVGDGREACRAAVAAAVGAEVALAFV